jgi:hypothetical protein
VAIASTGSAGLQGCSWSRATVQRPRAVIDSDAALDLRVLWQSPCERTEEDDKLMNTKDFVTGAAVGAGAVAIGVSAAPHARQPRESLPAGAVA